jgi:hypothetical protein
VPFHWEIEFPEVFARDNPGFDCFVGNPPFAGKNTITDTSGALYLDWLKGIHAEAHGNSDLVAHFFRRAFTLVRRQGTFALIATNTIAQGDTRGTGLRWIGQNGGAIYHATRRTKWPGLAAVVVSIVAVQKEPSGPVHAVLDGLPVERVSAFLFHRGGDQDPAVLKANAEKSFIGSYVLGMGFTFDDENLGKGSSPVAEMHRLIAKDPRNAERIFPYLGGEELNSSPTHAHHRFVINFAQMTEQEARQWPDLMAVVEQRVKPERLQLRDNPIGRRRKGYWWQWGGYTPGLYTTIRGMDRVLAIARVSQHCAFTFLPPGTVPSEQVVVFASSQCSLLAALQSRLHEAWARFLGSTLGETLRYTPSGCLETFPFPPNDESNAALESVGNAYYDFRAALMVRNNEGLTKTYNRFHNSDERSLDIQKLRELHVQIDRVVLDAYGWSDVQPVYDFREQLDESIRLTWGEDIRDEVLARLLELNRVRAEDEGKQVSAGPKKSAGRKPRKTTKVEDAKVGLSGPLQTLTGASSELLGSARDAPRIARIILMETRTIVY